LPHDNVILAFDTSAAHCAVALVSGGRIIAETVEEMTKGQAERLFPLIQDLLLGAGLAWKDIARIGVGIGPGNFTGIRISVAGARGLSLSLGVPAIGVSAFEALGCGLDGKIIASVDARGGKCYLKDLTQDRDPIMVNVADAAHVVAGSDFQVTGYKAEEIARTAGAKAILQPTPIAVAIALITARRDPANQGRPAPLYIRAPDAAPSRQTVPTILP